MRFYILCWISLSLDATNWPSFFVFWVFQWKWANLQPPNCLWKIPSRSEPYGIETLKNILIEARFWFLDLYFKWLPFPHHLSQNAVILRHKTAYTQLSEKTFKFFKVLSKKQLQIKKTSTIGWDTLYLVHNQKLFIFQHYALRKI